MSSKTEQALMSRLEVMPPLDISLQIIIDFIKERDLGNMDPLSMACAGILQELENGEKEDQYVKEEVRKLMQKEGMSKEFKPSYRQAMMYFESLGYVSKNRKMEKIYLHLTEKCLSELII